MLCFGSEENLLKRVLVQISHVPCAIVILAVAGDRQITVYGDIIFRLAREGRAIETLAANPGRRLEVKLQPLAYDIADDPIKSSLFHAAIASVSLRVVGALRFGGY